MGYGQLVSGMTSASRRKSRGGSTREISKYRGQRDRITAAAQAADAGGQALVSLYKGWSEGQSQWKNVEAGASELGLEQQVSEKRAGASWWERQTGPSQKTLDDMVTSTDWGEDEKLDISMGELKTMGRIKREAGSRFIKTLDPATGKYKDVKDSGWGTKTTPEESEVKMPGLNAPYGNEEKEYFEAQLYNTNDKKGSEEGGGLLDNVGQNLNDINRGSLGEDFTIDTSSVDHSLVQPIEETPGSATNVFDAQSSQLGGLVHGEGNKEPSMLRVPPQPEVQEESFDDIFRKQRKLLGEGKEFEYKGGMYTTNYAGEG